jgi:creatinine deaminase
MSLDHEKYMRLAYEQALKGYGEGGCPIGGVLVDNATGKVLGAGHNTLVQEGNPVIHGEMAAMRAAGRMLNRHHTTLYTTLQPCFMCTGTITQFGIPRVVVADAVNAASDETIRFLADRGVEVIVLDPKTSKAAADCIALCAKFREEKPALWLEDWGGGPNRAIATPGRHATGRKARITAGLAIIAVLCGTWFYSETYYNADCQIAQWYIPTPNQQTLGCAFGTLADRFVAKLERLASERELQKRLSAQKAKCMMDDPTRCFP